MTATTTLADRDRLAETTKNAVAPDASGDDDARTKQKQRKECTLCLE